MMKVASTMMKTTMMNKGMVTKILSQLEAKSVVVQ